MDDEHGTMGPVQGAFTVLTLVAASGVLLAGALARAAFRRVLRDFGFIPN